VVAAGHVVVTEVQKPAADLNDLVRRYWETTPNGTAPAVAGPKPADPEEWFRGIEERRYRLEPFIHSIAQFTRHRGERVLEVGVGVGTDHLQWARAGARCAGVDITDAGVEITRQRLAAEGLTSDLRRTDAERLPFEADSFDLVYSWGVIHHSDRPDSIIGEIRRTLRPGGRFIGMMYHRHSAVAVRMWLRHALLAGRPSRSLGDVLWHHMESVGTKAYTRRELLTLFDDYCDVRLQTLVTAYDRERLPGALANVIPSRFGWFIVIDARKPE
jgi:SAM-dependent methyltransferase